MTSIPGAYDGSKIVIGIDWYKTCTPLLLPGSFWAPTPLFGQQLKDLARDYPVQFIIVSFSGHAGCDQTEWEIERFVAHCYSSLGIPFLGYNITKSPIGEQGKAATIPELECCIFVDDRSDVRNEVARTGCRTVVATNQQKKCPYH